MTEATYKLIPVKDVRNNVYVLENGGLRAVLSVSGINFSLLSEKEQSLIINQFKNFLDGLEFPIEILVLSRLENINNYLKVLHLRLEEENDPLIKFQLEEYINFLEDYIQNHQIMKKVFYCIVPYDVIEIKGSFIKPKEKTNIEESFQDKLEQIEIRVKYVSDFLSEIGLSVERLNDLELIKLLYEIYNPNLRWAQIPKELIEKLVEIL